jgi:hypothetical protein
VVIDPAARSPSAGNRSQPQLFGRCGSGYPPPRRESSAPKWSGGPPLIPVVKAADLRYGNDGSEFRWVNSSRVGRVLCQ